MPRDFTLSGAFNLFSRDIDDLYRNSNPISYVKPSLGFQLPATLTFSIGFLEFFLCETFFRNTDRSASDLPSSGPVHGEKLRAIPWAKSSGPSHGRMLRASQWRDAACHPMDEHLIFARRLECARRGTSRAPRRVHAKGVLIRIGHRRI